ncbi:MAG: putative transcriptional regulator [Acidobacteria bacterium]|jgi:DNA-binding transcriptional ArsR family regulator|nr:putative transcriptional regulator [Acidobacteriota bacterium]
MRKTLAITNALADESRVRALLALARGRLCVCQIAELLQLAPSTVSKHLSILRHGGLVEARKQGRWIYYSIPNQPDASVRQSIEWVQGALKGDSRILDDEKRLKHILKEDPEEICRRQLGRSKSCSPPSAPPHKAGPGKVGRAG